jgi:hypothetical protein
MMATDSILQTPFSDAAPRRKRRRLLYVTLGLFILAGAIAVLVHLATPAEPPEAAAPDPVTVHLAALTERLATMDKRIAGLDSGQQQLQAGVVELKDKLDKPAPVAPPPVIRHYPVRAPKPPPVPVPVTPPDNTQLLSVDTWDDKPSIVLRAADGAVLFAQDGETTALGRFSVGRMGSQTVRVEHRDGSSALLHAAEDR